MKIKSNVTFIEYKPEDVVFIPNILQATAYFVNGAQIVDVNVQNGRLALGFWRSEHRKFKPLWDKRLLSLENPKEGSQNDIL